MADQISPFQSQLGVNNLLDDFGNIPPGGTPKMKGTYQQIVTVTQLLNVLGDARIAGKIRNRLTLSQGITSTSGTNLSINSSTGIIDFGGATLSNCSLPGAGFVVGPNSSVSGNLASFNGTSGKIIQDSGVSSLDVVTLNGTQTLTNKSLSDSTTAIVDVSDVTKRIMFDVGGTTGTKTTLTCAQTADRVATFPDVDGTVALVDPAYGIANNKTSIQFTMTTTTTSGGPVQFPVSALVAPGSAYQFATPSNALFSTASNITVSVVAGRLRLTGMKFGKLTTIILPTISTSATAPAVPESLPMCRFYINIYDDVGLLHTATFDIPIYRFGPPGHVTLITWPRLIIYLSTRTYIEWEINAQYTYTSGSMSLLTGGGFRVLLE